MAAPPDYPQRVTREPREDCRDYLRTGRCKYGASCKYNHPPNVQNGGGIKVPVDPSEPLFPIRPNEPACQYYMKHGTCKFGQACKFHHPPQSAMRAAIVDGNAVMMNLGSGRTGEASVAQHVVLHPIEADESTVSSMAFQFLPQRPDEADCIYFLRNGRCKYGATCRYHHPLPAHFREQDLCRPTRRNHSTQETTHVTVDAGRRNGLRTDHQQISSNYAAQYRAQVGGPTHILLSEGPVSFISVNNAGGVTSSEKPYQKMSVGLAPSSAIGIRKDYSSVPSSPVITSSSVASSYETASSELLPPAAGESMSSTWGRPSRNTSSGSLSSFGVTESPKLTHQYRRKDMIPHLNSSVSETDLAGRHHSAMESSQGANGGIDVRLKYSRNGWPGRNASQGAPQASLDNDVCSHDSGAIPFRPSGRVSRSRLTGNNEGISQKPPRVASEPFQDDAHDGGRFKGTFQTNSQVAGSIKESHRRHVAEFDDDGMSMMTSALLTMLDTQDENGDDVAGQGAVLLSDSSTLDGFRTTGDRSTSSMESFSQHASTDENFTPRQNEAPHDKSPRAMTRGLLFHAGGGEFEATASASPSSKWSPNTKDGSSISHSLEQGVQSFQAIYKQAYSPTKPTYGGLYIP